MTKLEQHMAIAEYLGIVAYDESPLYGFTEKDGKACQIPDFCNSLDAMHEVWLHLCRGDDLEAEGLRVTYGEQLEEIAVREIRKRGGSTQYMLPNLTASQRAEAFLKCLDLWKPSTVPKCDSQLDSKDDDCGHLNKVPLPSKDTKKEGGDE